MIGTKNEAKHIKVKTSAKKTEGEASKANEEDE